jgi:hypothetical protein
MSAETVVEFRSNRMTQAEYERERERIKETYGDSARDAGARRDQELAKLFYRSGWTQEVLAQKEGVTRISIVYRLRFGRFLEHVTTVTNPEFTPSNLSERKFRSYWERTDKEESNERIRFRAVLDLIHEETRLGQSTAPKFAVGRALVEKFADGKWHARETIGKAFPETPPTDIDAVLYHMHAKGTYGCRLEKRKNGRSFDVRIFRKVREVPAGELKEKLGPLIKQIETEGRKNAATLSVSTVALLGVQLRKLLEEWTE